MGEMDVKSLDARGVVTRLLEAAVGAGASDIHIDPEAGGHVVRFRVDGLLAEHERWSAEVGRSAVARLMVMAGLLTYRPDVPQEGRASVAVESAGGVVSVRLAVMPTNHGLRAVVRLPAELTQPRGLGELGLSESAAGALRDFARGDAGLLLVTGPAGSGKTTTIYALLEFIRETQPGLSIVSLEDPVERDLSGVTQIEVKPFGELTYERALRSVLRQDPQVLVLGEIRDRETAGLAVQAGLSGHRLISTLHAGDPAEAVARLLEMGVEAYQVASVLRAVVSLRLVRRLAGGGSAAAGEGVGTAYRGRAPVAEAATFSDASVREAVLDGSDAGTLRGRLRAGPGYRTMREHAARLVEAGVTDAAEVERVLGR